MTDYKFVPFVLTHHAKERMRLRDISASMIAHTLADPHSTETMDDGSKKYIRFTNGRQHHVVAFYNVKQEKWIVKSTWVRGENDSFVLKLYYKIVDWLQNIFKT